MHEDLAPCDVAVLPVVKNKEAIVAMAGDVHARLLPLVAAADYDETQSIGKRYRRADEAGTPLCLTVDGQSAVDGTVTLRSRDSMAQVRMHVDEVLARAQRRALKPSAIDFPPPTAAAAAAAAATAAN